MKLIFGFLLLTVVRLSAADWPQFFGPNRNGTSPETNLSGAWPKEGPVVVWKTETGEGFSGPAVAAGKLVLFERKSDAEIVRCLDAKSGATLWHYSYPSHYRDNFGFDEGPRGTPAIVDGKVFTMGAEGAVRCLDFNNGRLIWAMDAKTKFGSPKGFFGMACSPLVDGGTVVLNIGGQNGAGIIGLDKTTGALKWKQSDVEASYASPVPDVIQGRHVDLVFTRAGLTALDPNEGKVSFEFPWRSREYASVNAATPVLSGHYIFLTASYGTGAALLDVSSGAPRTVWSNDDSLSCHYNTPVVDNGFLYGVNGRADPGMEPRPSLRCVEMKTGRICWSQEDFGAATIILADRQFFILTEKGELVRAPVDSKGFHETGRAQVMPVETRACPALADGFLYCRGKNKLVCFNLRY